MTYHTGLSETTNVSKVGGQDHDVARFVLPTRTLTGDIKYTAKDVVSILIMLTAPGTVKLKVAKSGRVDDIGVIKFALIVDTSVVASDGKSMPLTILVMATDSVSNAHQIVSRKFSRITRAADHLGLTLGEGKNGAAKGSNVVSDLDQVKKLHTEFVSGDANTSTLPEIEVYCLAKVIGISISDSSYEVDVIDVSGGIDTHEGSSSVSDESFSELEVL